MHEKYNVFMEYKILNNQIHSLIDPALPIISNLSNVIAFLFHELPNLNWIGIYYCDLEQKVCYLGPFQGRVACTKIPFGKGVVGTCATKKKSMNIENVHTFPGHIACDSTSKSEFVAPLFQGHKLYAILDIDSDIYHRFSLDDIVFLEGVAHLLSCLISNEQNSIS